MTPEEIIELLGLERGTCGYMGPTYRSPLAVAPDGEFESGAVAVLHQRHPEFAGQLAAFAPA